MRKTFFNYISFFQLPFKTYRFWFFSLVNYFFYSNVGFTAFVKLYFQNYNLFFYYFVYKLLLGRKIRYIFLNVFCLFNPGFPLIFKLPNVKLAKLSSQIEFVPNVTNKIYYNFIKFMKTEFYFTERFLTVNSNIYNTNYLTIKNVLYNDFFFVLRSLDFRYIFFFG